MLNVRRQTVWHLHGCPWSFSFFVYTLAYVYLYAFVSSKVIYYVYSYCWATSSRSTKAEHCNICRCSSDHVRPARNVLFRFSLELLTQKQQYLTVSIREALNVHFVFASVPENVASRLFVCLNEPRQNNNVESCATHRINAVRNCLTLIGWLSILLHTSIF